MLFYDGKFVDYGAEEVLKGIKSFAEKLCDPIDAHCIRTGKDEGYLVMWSDHQPAINGIELLEGAVESIEPYSINFLTIKPKDVTPFGTVILGSKKKPHWQENEVKLYTLGTLPREDYKPSKRILKNTYTPLARQSVGAQEDPEQHHQYIEIPNPHRWLAATVEEIIGSARTENPDHLDLEKLVATLKR